MKKFNPQIKFFHWPFILLLIIFSSCKRSVEFKVLSGETLQLSDSATVFIFLSSECPVCTRYQGEFRKLYRENRGTSFFYVFSGNNNKEEVMNFCSYDSIMPSQVIIDPAYSLSERLDAKVTPQAIVMKEKRTRYSGKIDDRFRNLGNSKPKASVNYVNNALNSLSKNEEVQITRTGPVGCFIERR